MAAKSGVRDGEFVRFSNWDLPGEDQAYLPKLKGKVSELKKVVLEKQGNMFFAFNTNGRIKSWAKLDFNKFQQSQSSDLFVRVEYPGWYFVEGKDSPYNNLGQIEDVSTSTGLKEAVLGVYQGDNKVAAFNTNGWVKSKVVYPLTDASSHSLSGIYIRTTFLDYNFYPNIDSNGNNIKRTLEYMDDVPKLIQVSSGLSNSGGFNTNGWHKYALEGPPPATEAPSLKEPYQGVYYRTCWPDFVYLPGLDSPDSDIRNVGNKQLHDILDEARKDPKAIAVDTDGWLKHSLVNEPQDFPGAENLKGIYVKILDSALMSAAESTAENTLLSTAFFSLKGTAIIWSKWILKDANVRQEYRRAVAAATDDILKRIDDGSLTPVEGAVEAHQLRNNYLIGMRDKTSPPGLLVARAIKPAGGSYQYYLDKNAQNRYQKSFADLTPEEAKQVAIDTISSAGRANPKVTELMRRAGMVSKGVIVVAAAVSVYSVATAQDWETELGKQVVSWSGAIAGGELGVGVGTLVGGPIGAILGGIAGSILAGLGADALANWFFGGSSGSRAVELLGFALKPATKLVEDQVSKDGCRYYTHTIRASHAAAYESGETSFEGHTLVAEMVEDIPDSTKLKAATVGSSDEVFATIVWIRVEGRTLPKNAKNPKDLVTLMEYVKMNLP